MSEAKPTIMTAVPRFYQNFLVKLILILINKQVLKKNLINKTIELGKKKH